MLKEKKKRSKYVYLKIPDIIIKYGPAQLDAIKYTLSCRKLLGTSLSNGFVWTA